MVYCLLEAGNVGAASVLRLRRCPDEKKHKKSLYPFMYGAGVYRCYSLRQTAGGGKYNGRCAGFQNGELREDRGRQY